MIRSALTNSALFFLALLMATNNRHALYKTMITYIVSDNDEFVLNAATNIRTIIQNTSIFSSFLIILIGFYVTQLYHKFNIKANSKLFSSPIFSWSYSSVLLVLLLSLLVLLLVHILYLYYFQSIVKLFQLCFHSTLVAQLIYQ